MIPPGLCSGWHTRTHNAPFVAITKIRPSTWVAVVPWLRQREMRGGQRDIILINSSSSRQTDGNAYLEKNEVALRVMTLRPTDARISRTDTHAHTQKHCS